LDILRQNFVTMFFGLICIFWEIFREFLQLYSNIWSTQNDHFLHFFWLFKTLGGAFSLKKSWNLLKRKLLHGTLILLSFKKIWYF
jgi:hypothetical protein